MITKLFISRPPQDIPLLAKFCKDQQIELEAKSLIRFEPLEFEQAENYDVVFFSSIRSAIFSISSLDKSKPVACIGKATAEKVRALGFEVTFVGDKSGDPESFGAEFKQWLGDRKVFLPVSNLSAGTIERILEPDQVIKRTVYQTVPTTDKIEKKDLYVFSSPSNFVAFSEINKLPACAKTIAWGKTTAKAMSEKGLDPDFTLETGNESEVIQLLTEK